MVRALLGLAVVAMSAAPAGAARTVRREHLIERVHAVADLATDAEQNTFRSEFVDIIQATVAPKSWASEKGRGTIA